MYVFVIHHTYNEMQLSVRLLFQLLCDIGDTTYIVSGITYQSRGVLQFLPTSHQSG